MKKKLIVTMLIVGMMAFVGCNKNNQNNMPKVNDNTVAEHTEDIEEVKPENNKFIFGNNEYVKNKDILEKNQGEVIFDNRADLPYVRGEYVEVDFANDLLTEYLGGNKEIYNSIFSVDENNRVISVTDKDKERLEHSLKYLREQMGLGDEAPIYFKLESITYDGFDSKSKMYNLKVKGYISGDNESFISLSSFELLIKEDDSSIMANIS